MVQKHFQPSAGTIGDREHEARTVITRASSRVVDLYIGDLLVRIFLKLCVLVHISSPQRCNWCSLKHQWRVRHKKAFKENITYEYSLNVSYRGFPFGDSHRRVRHAAWRIGHTR